MFLYQYTYMCVYKKRKVELIGQKKLAFCGTLTDFGDVQQAFDFWLNLDTRMKTFSFNPLSERLFAISDTKNDNHYKIFTGHYDILKALLATKKNLRPLVVG